MLLFIEVYSILSVIQLNLILDIVKDFVAYKVIVDLDDFVFATFMQDKLKDVILNQ